MGLLINTGKAPGTFIAPPKPPKLPGGTAPFVNGRGPAQLSGMSSDGQTTAKQPGIPASWARNAPMEQTFGPGANQMHMAPPPNQGGTGGAPNSDGATLGVGGILPGGPQPTAAGEAEQAPYYKQPRQTAQQAKEQQEQQIRNGWGADAQTLLEGGKRFQEEKESGKAFVDISSKLQGFADSGMAGAQQALDLMRSNWASSQGYPTGQQGATAAPASGGSPGSTRPYYFSDDAAGATGGSAEQTVGPGANQIHAAPPPNQGGSAGQQGTTGASAGVPIPGGLLGSTRPYYFSDDAAGATGGSAEQTVGPAANQIHMGQPPGQPPGQGNVAGRSAGARSSDFGDSLRDFMESMKDYAPGSAPSLQEQADLARMMASSAYTAPELTADQRNQLSSAWRAEQLMNADSPLLRLAQNRAMQAGNARGLLNSSASVNAGTQAMLAEAGNYGRADAQLFGSMLANDRAAEARSRDMFAQAAFGDAQAQRNAESQYRNQMLQMAGNSFEKGLDRDFTAERDERQNAFAAQQAALGNQWALERDSLGRDFTAEQNELSRGQALKAAQMQIDASKALSAQGHQQSLGQLSQQQAGALKQQTAGLQGQLQNSLTLGDQSYKNQSALNAQNAEASKQTALELAKANAETQAGVRREAAQRALRSQYDSAIEDINDGLATQISKIQASDLPADVKTGQIRSAQRMAQQLVKTKNALFTANQDWVSSWSTFDFEIDESLVGVSPSNPVTNTTGTSTTAPTTPPTTTTTTPPTTTTTTPTTTTTTPTTTTTTPTTTTTTPTTTTTTPPTTTTTPPTSGIDPTSDADIAAHLKQLGFADDDGNVETDEQRLGVYNEAKKFGMSARRLAQFLKLPLADVNAWIAAKGLAPL